VQELLRSKYREGLKMALELAGYPSYLSQQQEAAAIATYLGLDVVASIPTAGGKSMIYQLPIYADIFEVRTMCGQFMRGCASAICTAALDSRTNA